MHARAWDQSPFDPTKNRGGVLLPRISNAELLAISRGEATNIVGVKKGLCFGSFPESINHFTTQKA